jgi:hypothetical protein
MKFDLFCLHFSHKLLIVLMYAVVDKKNEYRREMEETSIAIQRDII